MRYDLTSGDDVVTGTSDSDFVDGYKRAFTPTGTRLRFSGGSDQVATGAGRDEIYVFTDRAQIDAGSNHDIVVAWLNKGTDNVIHGGSGNDKIEVRTYGKAGAHVYGDAGDDTFRYLMSGHQAGRVYYDGGSDSDTVEILEDHANVVTWQNTTVTSVENLLLKDDIIFPRLMPHFRRVFVDPGVPGSQPHKIIVGGDWHGRVIGDARIESFALKTVIDLSDAKGSLTIDTGRAWRDGGWVNLVATGTVRGGSGNDDITAHGLDYSELSGGDGDDRLRTGSGKASLFGDDGRDTLRGGIKADWLDGGNDDDKLYGGDGYDKLFGGAGTDWLSGDAGNDRLNGGDGDDMLDGGAGDDTLVGAAGVDLLVGGDGNDTAQYTVSAVTASLADPSLNAGRAAGDVYDSIENLGGSEWNDVLYGDGNANILTGNAGQDLLSGGDGNDTLTGNNGSDTLIGGAGDDVLTAGDDVEGHGDLLEGGAGADTLTGSSKGQTIATYEHSTAGVSIDLMAQTAHGGDAEGDVLAAIPNLIGSAFDDVLTASDYDAVRDFFIRGGDGDDRITSRNGSDTSFHSIYGDAGNDTLDIARGLADAGSGDDTIIGHYHGLSLVLDGGGGRLADVTIGGEGYDTIDFSALTAGGAYLNYVEVLESGSRMSGQEVREVEHVIGSSFTDNITLDAFGRLVDAGEGNDTVVAGAGAAALNGAAGDDALTGGNGADTLDGGIGADLLVGGAGNDFLTGGIGGIGDGISAIGIGADTLEGGAGADTLVGSTFGATIASYAHSATGVAVDLAAGTASGGDAEGDALTAIRGLVGSAFDDVLTADAFTRRLDGGAGDDTLVAGTGHTTLLGGMGDDLFAVTAAAAVATIIADFQKGSDRVDLAALHTDFAALSFVGEDADSDGVVDDARVTIGSGDDAVTLLLLDVSPDALGATDFLF